MNIRIAIIPYARLRRQYGTRSRTPRRMLSVCGVLVWRR
jgi:hypothetical protein